MSGGYFWSFGDCKQCGWPHHFRYDVAFKRARWWRTAREASSCVRCCNCGLVTDIPPYSSGRVST